MLCIDEPTKIPDEVRNAVRLELCPLGACHRGTDHDRSLVGIRQDEMDRMPGDTCYLSQPLPLTRVNRYGDRQRESHRLGPQSHDHIQPMSVFHRPLGSPRDTLNSQALQDAPDAVQVMRSIVYLKPGEVVSQ